MPEYDLQGLTFELEGDDSVLGLHFLADQAVATPDLQASLRAFVDRYDEWIHTLRNSHEDLAPWMEEAAIRNLARLQMTAGRMRAGIDALSDPTVRQSFALTHRAMLMQMCHSAEALGGTRRSIADAIKQQLITALNLGAGDPSSWLSCSWCCPALRTTNTKIERSWICCGSQPVEGRPSPTWPQLPSR